MIDIVVPQVGEAVAEVTLVRWLKKPGDSVEKGEPLFEVDTDKSVVEVEAFASGTLAEILVGDGSSVMPKDVVGRIDSGASASAPASPAAPATEALPGAAPRRAEPASAAPAPAALRGAPPGARVPATPRARRTAHSLGIDLSLLRDRGTGVDGLVRVRDVEKAAAGLLRGKGTGAAGPLGAGPVGAPSMRRAIAQRTLASKQAVPHYYLMVDADMSQTAALRRFCVDHLGWERPPTYTDLIVKAAAVALAGMPQLNVSYRDEGLSSFDTVDVGVAVALEKGLIVPSLRDVPGRDLKWISETIRGLAQRARQGRLKGSELSRKSITVTNLGMHGIDAFVAIIDMPDPMILAVGAVQDRVVAVEGLPAVRPVCTLTLSVDHRAIDGAPAARYLARVKAHLENPYLLLDGGTR